MGHPRFLWLVLISFCFVSKVGAQCDVLDFGAADDDPITIDENTDLDDDCTLDFGDREVILDANLTGNNITILAGKLTIESGANIVGGSSTTTIVLTESATHDGSLTLSGEIDHNDSDLPGTVVITADGLVGFSDSGNIRARGTTVDADGGVIEVTTAGDIEINGAATSLNVSSGGDAWGGSVVLTSTAGSITMNENINASGGSFDGGTVEITADLSIEIAGNIDLNAGCFDGFCGDGGDIDLIAGTSITILGQIETRGPAGGLEDGGGSGGYVTIDAGTDITVDNNIDLSCGYFGDGGVYSATCAETYEHLSGRVRVDGRNIDSWGGSLDVLANDALINDSNEAGGGSDGVAGDITIRTTETLEINGDIECSANSDGSVTLESTAADVVITSQVTAEGRGSEGTGSFVSVTAATGIDISAAHLDVSGNGSSGTGGTVLLTAGLDIVADAATRVRANGSGPGGSGGDAGTITIDGCAVTIPADSLVLARGDTGGTISIASLDLLTLGGRVEADTDGTITLTYPSDVDPDLAGAEFDPEADEVELVDPPACSGAEEPLTFMRGDVNGNGVTSALTDALTLLSWAFNDGADLPCDKAADVNGNLELSALTDSLFLLNFVFADGDVPPDPGPTSCGEDPDEDNTLGCETPSLVCS